MNTSAFAKATETRGAVSAAFASKSTQRAAVYVPEGPSAQAYNTASVGSLASTANKSFNKSLQQGTGGFGTSAKRASAQMSELHAMIESWRRDFKEDTDRVDESFEFNQIEADRKSGAASALAGRAAGSQPSSAERRATAAAALEQEHPFPMVSGEAPAERVPVIGLEHGDSSEDVKQR